MNLKIRKLTIFVVSLVGAFLFSTTSEAYSVYVNTGPGYYGYHGKSHRVRVYCKYTGGYWKNGYWHYGHKVCYTRRR